MRTLLLLLAAAATLPAQIGSKSIVPINVARKVALVIGNSVYNSDLEPIPAAANDADDMAAALRRLNFEVVVKKNLGGRALINEIGVFKATIHPGDLALLYYSGHGASLGEENYLLPVDYDLPVDPDLVKHEAYAMSDVRDAMEKSGALVRVLIFDACRSPALRNKGSEGNPVSIEGTEGTVIAFASAHKQDSFFDARDRNSLYTKRLLAALNSPDADLKGLLEGVQLQVYRDTARRQTPFLYAFLSGPLYLAGTPRNAAPPKPDAAQETWDLIRDSRNPEVFENFAKAYKESPLARGAEIQAARLRQEFPDQERLVVSLSDDVKGLLAKMKLLERAEGDVAQISRNPDEADALQELGLCLLAVLSTHPAELSAQVEPILRRALRLREADRDVAPQTLALALELNAILLKATDRSSEAAPLLARMNSVRQAGIGRMRPRAPAEGGPPVKADVQPTITYKVDPEYSEPARLFKYSGTVTLSAIIGVDGALYDLRVVKGLGLGLDEKAVEAIVRWKFQPGMRNGQAVNVRGTFAINFRLL
jgi:TonB family protein